MRLAAFLASFLTAMLMSVLCIVAMVFAAARPDADGAAAIIYCGPLLLLPFAGWALAEWQAYVMGRARSEWQGALCSAAFGGLLLFAGTASLAQGLPESAGPWANTILAAVLALGASLLTAGAIRLRAGNAAIEEPVEDEPPEEQPNGQ